MLLQCFHRTPATAADAVTAHAVFANREDSRLAMGAGRLASKDAGDKFTNHRSFLVDGAVRQKNAMIADVLLEIRRLPDESV
jgi:hypothetical protein